MAALLFASGLTILFAGAAMIQGDGGFWCTLGVICVVIGSSLLVASIVVFFRRRGAASPQLSFGEPKVGDLQQLSYPLSQNPPGIWQSLGGGRVVRIPVVNAQGAGDAVGVHATLRFTDAEGNPEMDDQPGRWRDQPDKPEITIPGNGREYELDLFVRFSEDPNGCCYVWNNESVVAGVRRDEFRCDARDFLLRIIVKGKHRNATLDKTWRVYSLLHPQIVPKGQKFAWE
jgi:hypothetical protein